VQPKKKLKDRVFFIKMKRHLLKLNFIVGVIFSQFALCQNLKIYELNEVPDSISKAVLPSALLNQNKLITGLNKATTGSITALVQLETYNDFKIYKDSVRIQTQSDPALKGNHWQLVISKFPESESFLDPISHKIKEGFKGQAVFEVELSLNSGLSHPLPNDHKIPLLISFQACSTELCLLPVTVRLYVPTQKSSFTPITKKSKPSLSTRLSDNLKNLLNKEHQTWMILAILFLAGILTSLTPCVYPLYPITLGIFTRWSHQTHLSALLLALCYSFGLTLSYALFGLVTVASGTLFGSLTQRPEYYLFMGVVLMLATLAFSGLFNIQAPLFIQNVIAKFSFIHGKKPKRWTYLAQSFFMGLTLGVVAAPCVGPVLVALLGFLSSTFAQGNKNYLQGFIWLSAFGVGMSTPFLILGHYTIRLHKKLLLSPYTHLFKHVGTFLLFIAALTFLIPGIRLYFSHTPKNATLNFAHYEWNQKPKNTWKIVDFRADWCTACLQFESETLASAEVSELFITKKWAYVPIDVTNFNEEKQKIAAEFNVLSLPTILIENPEGKICEKLSLHEFENSQAFLERLNKAELQCL
jgi:thiol:disulfide interchange protein DsbD